MAGITDSYGAGDEDVYLIKTDAAGNMAWSKTFGGINRDYGYSVVQTSDGGYAIAGYTDSYGAGGWDVYLIKTDSTGTEQWHKTFGGTNDDYGYSVVQTSDGGYAIAGYTDSYGAGDEDVYLIKTDSTGIEQWHKTFGGASWDIGVYLAQTSDGGYIITGATFSYGAGGDDVYLIRVETEQVPVQHKPNPNPGTVFYERDTSWSDSVRFYLTLRDMNKTRGRSNFQLTITDTNNTVVFSKTFSIRHRTNWYVFHLNQKWFNEGEYTANAVAETWSTSKNITIP